MHPDPTRADAVNLTATEAAHVFGVGIGTVWSWVHRSKLAPVGTVRINGRSVQTFAYRDLSTAAYTDGRVRAGQTAKPVRHIA